MASCKEIIEAYSTGLSNLLSKSPPFQLTAQEIESLNAVTLAIKTLKCIKQPRFTESRKSSEEVAEFIIGELFQAYLSESSSKKRLSNNSCV